MVILNPCPTKFSGVGLRCISIRASTLMAQGVHYFAEPCHLTIFFCIGPAKRTFTTVIARGSRRTQYVYAVPRSPLVESCFLGGFQPSCLLSPLDSLFLLLLLLMLMIMTISENSSQSTGRRGRATTRTSSCCKYCLWRTRRPLRWRW